MRPYARTCACAYAGARDVPETVLTRPGGSTWLRSSVTRSTPGASAPQYDRRPVSKRTKKNEEQKKKGTKKRRSGSAGRTEGGGLGRLEDHRVTGDESGRQLERKEQQRRVPLQRDDDQYMSVACRVCRVACAVQWVAPCVRSTYGNDGADDADGFAGGVGEDAGVEGDGLALDLRRQSAEEGERVRNQTRLDPALRTDRLCGACGRACAVRAMNVCAVRCEACCAVSVVVPAVRVLTWVVGYLAGLEGGELGELLDVGAQHLAALGHQGAASSVSAHKEREPHCVVCVSCVVRLGRAAPHGLLAPLLLGARGQGDGVVDVGLITWCQA